MNADDREEILAEGWERLVPQLLDAQRLNDEFLAVLAEIERIRRDVEQRTGVSLIEPPPLTDQVADEFEALMESAFPGEMTA